jgi:drug/metabolite transporter (DMT)-like permease
MHWLPLGVSSTALFACIAIIDKVVLERYFKNNWSYPFFTAFFLGVYCMGILAARFFLGLFQSPSLWITFLALLPGLLHFMAALTTTRALLKADASTVFGISQITPFFTLIWGTLFFDNIFALINYLGIFLVVICAIFLAWEKPTQAIRKFRLHHALGWILAGALLRSLSDLFTKIAVTELAFWDAFALSRIAMLMPAFYIFWRARVRTDILAPVRKHGWKIVGIAAVIEVFALFNLMILTLAFSRGPLALVSATQATVPLFILLFGGLVNHIKPDLVPIRDNSLSMPAKILLCGGIMAGIYLLYIPA